MSNSIIYFVLGVFLLALCPEAEAACEYPIEWSVFLETHGSNDSWDSITNITPGCPQYVYSWGLDYAEVEIFGISWYNIMDRIPEYYKSGSGTKSFIPFIAFDEDIGESGIFTAHVLAYVNAEGYATVFMTNVLFGQIEVDGIHDVTGFRCGGHAMLIPEPATLFLLAMGGILLQHKRRA